MPEPFAPRKKRKVFVIALRSASRYHSMDPSQRANERSCPTNLPLFGGERNGVFFRIPAIFPGRHRPAAVRWCRRTALAVRKKRLIPERCRPTARCSLACSPRPRSPRAGGKPYPINLPTAMKLGNARSLDIELATRRFQTAAAQCKEPRFSGCPICSSAAITIDTMDRSKPSTATSSAPAARA